MEKKGSDFFLPIGKSKFFPLVRRKTSRKLHFESFYTFFLPLPVDGKESAYKSPLYASLVSLHEELSSENRKKM